MGLPAGQRALAGRRQHPSTTLCFSPWPLHLLLLHQEHPFCTPCRSQPAHSPRLLATHSSDLCCNTPSSRKPSRMHPGWVRCLIVRAPYGPMPSWHLNHTKSPSPSHQPVSTSRHKVPPLFSSVSRARLVLNTSVKCILKATSPSALEHSLSSAPVLPSAAYYPPG